MEGNKNVTTWVGKTELDGVRSTSFIWKRFNSKKTARSGGGKLVRKIIVETVINCSLRPGSTHLDVIREIAALPDPPLPIASIPDVLGEHSHYRGLVLFGFLGNNIDKIALHYPHMQWWISEAGLHMQLSLPSTLSEFDEIAGKLMFDARPRRGENSHLPSEEYEKIARELDRADFKPVEHLEGKQRDALADWNRKYPTKAIKSFSVALSADIPQLKLRRAVQRRLNRAESAWKKQSKMSAQ